MTPSRRDGKRLAGALPAPANVDRISSLLDKRGAGDQVALHGLCLLNTRFQSQGNRPGWLASTPLSQTKAFQEIYHPTALQLVVTELVSVVAQAAIAARVCLVTTTLTSFQPPQSSL